MELYTIKNNEMKERLTVEYFRRLKRVLKSKLNTMTMIRAMNTWAVSVMRYGAGILNWTKAELQNIDRNTRKQMTMYRALHPRDSVDRIYVNRKNG